MITKDGGDIMEVVVDSKKDFQYGNKEIEPV
jgi:hypothetical protein